MKELWDLFDENRRPLNRKHIRGTDIPFGTYHVVVNVWTINKEGKILITQRHPDKLHGLLWECSGGSAVTGEDSITGALRELYEEVGIKAKAEELTLIHSIRLKGRFVDTYITTQDIRLEDLKLQKEEVVDARFVTFEELGKLWKDGVIIPRERYTLYRNRLETVSREVREKHMQIMIRPEKPDDFEKIDKLVYDSFHYGTNYSDGASEVMLVNEIRSLPYYIPELSFVAERDGELAGHFMFSHFPIGGKHEKEFLILAPVAVNYKLLRQGIGKSMLLQGIEQARDMGYKGISVEGNPAFYHKVGFVISTTYDIHPGKKCHLPDPECLMAQELYPGALKDISGTVDYDMYKTLT